MQRTHEYRRKNICSCEFYKQNFFMFFCNRSGFIWFFTINRIFDLTDLTDQQLFLTIYFYFVISILYIAYC